MRAQKQQAGVVPIRLDEAVMGAPEAWAADVRRTRHIGEFNRWRDHGSYNRALERLLRDLKAETPAQPESRSDGKS